MVNPTNFLLAWGGGRHAPNHALLPPYDYRTLHRLSSGVRGAEETSLPLLTMLYVPQLRTDDDLTPNSRNCSLSKAAREIGCCTCFWRKAGYCLTGRVKAPANHEAVAFLANYKPANHKPRHSWRQRGAGYCAVVIAVFFFFFSYRVHGLVFFFVCYPTWVRS